MTHPVARSLGKKKKKKEKHLSCASLDRYAAYKDGFKRSRKEAYFQAHKDEEGYAPYLHLHLPYQCMQSSNTSLVPVWEYELCFGAATVPCRLGQRLLSVVWHFACDARIIKGLDSGVSPCLSCRLREKYDPVRVEELQMRCVTTSASGESNKAKR